jgi:hypothetical protein
VSGVLQRERERRERWRRLGLPDPLDVLAAERVTRLYVRDFRSPRRSLLDDYFAGHPGERPEGW